MGFMPERLRDIRILNGYTVERVADYLGISKQAVSKYENGSAIPSVDILNRLMEFFSLPSGYLSRSEVIPEKKSGVFYRKVSRTSQKDMDKVQVCIKWFYEMIQESRKYGYDKLSNFPQMTSAQTIEEKAHALRNAWGLKAQPIGDLVPLLEMHGFFIFTVDLKESKIDGAFQCLDDIPIIIINAAKGSRERRNFSLAHELGHLVLHSSLENLANEQMEQEADLFAACFLMPEEALKREMLRFDIDSLTMFAEKWNVSPHAVLKRCAELNLLDGNEEEKKAHIDYLFKKLNKKANYYIAEERMICTLKNFLEEIDKDEIKRTDYLDKLCFPVKEVQKLCQMPEIFQQYHANASKEQIQDMDGVQLSFIY